MARTEVRDKFFHEFSDGEIRAGLAHAAKKYRQQLDFDHLRTLANEVGKRRQIGVLMPMMVGDVARDGFLRQRDIAEAARFEAYRGAVCKMFSERSAKKRHKAALERREAREPRLTERQKTSRYPCNKNGQYRML